MTNAWMLGATDSVPQDEDAVRDTRDPIRSDGGDSAEMDAPPDWNEFESDDSAQLTGLSNRNVAGHTQDPVKSAPWWAALSIFNHNRIIDDQVASSGTAAAREMAGQSGHGTMLIEQSIEPQIREGTRFGQEHFLSNEAVIQDGAGAYMTPVDTDAWNSAVAQRAATDNARKATQSSLYAAFLGN